MNSHQARSGSKGGIPWFDTDERGPSPQPPAPSPQPPAPSPQHPAPSTQHPAPSTQLDDKTHDGLTEDPVRVLLAVKPLLFSSVLAESLGRQSWAGSVMERPEILLDPCPPGIPKVDVVVLHAAHAPGPVARTVAIIAGARPELRILVLVGCCTGPDVAALVGAGATGIVLHCCSTTEFFDAIRRVSHFEQVLPATAGIETCGLADLDDAPGLTRRERTVMRMLTAGIKRCDIAAALNISGWTVDSHRKSALRKMARKAGGTGA